MSKKIHLQNPWYDYKTCCGINPNDYCVTTSVGETTCESCKNTGYYKSLVHMRIPDVENIKKTVHLRKWGMLSCGVCVPNMYLSSEVPSSIYPEAVTCQYCLDSLAYEKSLEEVEIRKTKLKIGVAGIRFFYRPEIDSLEIAGNLIVGERAKEELRMIKDFCSYALDEICKKESLEKYNNHIEKSRLINRW